MHISTVYPQNYLTTATGENGNQANIPQSQGMNLTPTRRYLRLCTIISAVAIVVIFAIVIIVVITSARDKNNSQSTTTPTNSTSWEMTTTTDTTTTHDVTTSSPSTSDTDMTITLMTPTTTTAKPTNTTTRPTNTTTRPTNTTTRPTTTTAKPTTTTARPTTTTARPTTTTARPTTTTARPTTTTAKPTTTTARPTTTTARPTTTRTPDTVRPLIALNHASDQIFGLYNTTAGGSTGGFNGIYATSFEMPDRAMDNSTSTKYLNFGVKNCSGCTGYKGGLGTGFLVIPSFSNATVARALRFATADDNPHRDPITVTLEGSNAPNIETLQLGTSWTLIYNGPTGINATHYPGNKTYGIQQDFPNSIRFASYRLLITSTRSESDAVQYSEAHILGYV